MLVNMKEMLMDAEKKGVAVGAFNCTTLETARAAIAAAEELNVPFILQHAFVHEQYIPLDLAAVIMLKLADSAKVPVCVHLDHGPSLEYASKALRLGFTSVMIDASAKDLEENIRETEAVTRIAHAVGATVEAELGNMPHNLSGEMDLSAYRPEDFYTNPADAKTFAERTGVDALAISFGTVHGVYQVMPKLNFDIIRAVREAVNGLPLVMHGGSGLSESDYHTAVACGIRKINYYTYEAMAGGEKIYELAQKIPEGLQFHDVAMESTAAMKENVKKAIRIFRGEHL